MKKQPIFTTLLLFLITSTFYGQTIIKSQSFDSGASGYSDDLTYTVSGTTSITNVSSESAPYAFKLNGNNSNITFENVDISSFSNVTATVSFSSVNANDNRDLYLDVSYNDGTSWNAIKLIDGENGAGGEDWPWGTPDNDGGAVNSNPYTFSIPDTENNVKIRLRANQADNSRFFYVDNIIIQEACTNTYCTTTYTSAVEAITNVTFGGINNTTGANTAGGSHEIFCTPTGSVTAGSSYTISLNGDTEGSYTNSFTAFFDWDQDGTFNNTTERYEIGTIYNNNGTGTPATNNIAVPTGATPGTTTMRIIKKFLTNYATDGCTPGSGYGQTEDYLINVTAATPCTEPTAQATALTFGTVTDTSIIGNFTAASPAPDNYLVLMNTTGTAPSPAPADTNTYAIGDTVGGATVIDTDANTTFTATGLSPTTTYYFYVYSFNSACSGGPDYYTTAPLSGNETTDSASYCEPTSWDPDGLYINSLAFVGTLADPAENTSTFNATGYQDFTGLSPIAIQAQGEGVNIVANATGNYYYRGTWKAWVDWNKDGDFNNTNELVYDIYGQVSANVTFGFEIPAAAAAGDYTMRIRVNNGFDSWFGWETYGFDFDACDDFDEYASYDFSIEDYGETEDYLFTVIESCDANIATITDGESCGAGTVDISATGTTGVTGFNIYTAETGGTALSPAPTFTTPGGVPTASWTSPSLTTTTTYWITATNGSCESLVRTPIVAEISPTPTVTFNPASPTICGDNEIIQLTAEGDIETVYLIKEDFETGDLGVFTTNNIINNGGSINNKTQWQNQTSVFIPNEQSWFPAISSGFGDNKFVISTSDVGSYTTHNELISPTINATDFLDLTLDFKIYHSRYYTDDTNATLENVNIEISTDGGTTYTTLPSGTILTDIASGSSFDTLSYNLNAYINEASLRLRIVYYAEWCDGVAIDDINLYGEKPVNTAFNYDTTTVDAYTDASGTISYTPNTPATTIYIKPTLSQLENATFTIPVSATLSNGCSATGNAVVTNNTKVFKGGGTDWNDATSWKPAGVPTLDNCVIIPDGETCKLPNNTTIPFPPIGYQAYAKNLTVQNTGALEIVTDNFLTVTDWVNVQTGGDLTVKSGGSLIQETDVTSNNNTGNITMERTATIASSYDYIYWSSPVEDFNVTNVSPGSSNIYEWIPTIGGNYGDWSATSENMIPGKGYIIRNISGTPTPSTPEFVGTPNNGIITKAITRGTYNGADYPGGGSTMATKLDDNWNLIGNPYPSAISADTFIATNAAAIGDDIDNTIQGTVYLWRHIQTPSNAINDPFYQDYVYNYNPNDYVAYNSTGSNPSGFDGKIASGQAFFVLMEHTAPVNSNVTFNNTMRNETLNNSQFYRTTEASQRTSDTEKHRIWLDLITPNNTANSILVGYVEGATNNKDKLYDAYELSETSARFYSIIEDEEMAIQGKALPFQDTDTVPLGIEIPQNGNYTIAINSVDGLFETTNQTIFLEDTYTNTIHNLRINPYSFNINTGIYNDRFILRYTDQSLSTNDFDLNALEILAPNNKYIKVKSGNNTIETVIVYDLLGRALINNQNVNANEFIINNFKFSEGAHIVKVILLNGKQKIQKVILKH
ncbi:T9SS type A sorting domain-containing protein [Lacinutrix sp. C3R15]|uniref:GEVED domain-containing protein n=1 Tax=Flavobacteriaceae TaxID=49546 RepID=UPI001C09208F|nr:MULTISPECIES: GEVED domain-containing protein [Flavobacteriaceae]MBU2939715.1 T9SS type A sorting domain-containing protein [Lacinutrix sp. C3R15]MDO6623030.1 GEVED domain-containing protein [Oceanihabitans sp. 1_MG-2023]